MPTDPPILNYAGPRIDPQDTEIRTDGRTDLYIPRVGAELARRCVMCNAKVRGKQKTVRLNYVDPEIRRSYRGGIMFYWIYLLVLIIRGIHERAVRQSVRFSYSVCPYHRSNRGGIVLLRWTAMLLCIALLPFANLLGVGDNAPFLVCIVIVLNLIIPWPRRQLRIDRMTRTHAVIVGPSREFLQSLRQTDR
jgi:hypothetical protein